MRYPQSHRWSHNLGLDVANTCEFGEHLGGAESRRAKRFAKGGTFPNRPSVVLRGTYSSPQFNCCGYFDINTPPFVKDNTCTGSLAATKLGPCIGPFSSFANNLLDVVFTAMFGLVGTLLASHVTPTHTFIRILTFLSC